MRTDRTGAPVVHPRLLIALLLAAAAQILFLLWPVLPLGLPGEWVWSRHAIPEGLSAAVAQFLPAGLGLVVFFSIAGFGNRRFTSHHTQFCADRRRQRLGPSWGMTALLLAALVAGTWVWQKNAENCTPARHRHLKSLWILYSPSSSGYFFEAAFEMDSSREFLKGYEERMREGEVYHVGTHPPGLFLLSHAAISICGTSPALQQFLLDWAPRDDLDAFRALESSARLQRRLKDHELAGLCLVSQITSLAAALTVLPVFWLVRRVFDAFVAWRTACLWATIPCVIVFLPKSDVLFAGTSMAAVCLGTLAQASHAPLWRRLPPAVGGGLVLWLGLMMSLAHLPVLAVLGLLFLTRLWRSRERAAQEGGSVLPLALREACVVFVLLLTIVLATVLFSLAFECNMLEVWRLNLTNHAGFYEQHTRTAWQWLLINPLELALSVGLPLAVAAVAGMARLRSASGRHSSCQRTLPIDFGLSVLTTLLLLWLSCRNSGEAARLWCFLTPWLLVFPAAVLRQETSSRQLIPAAQGWLTLLILQLLVCLVTVVRVNGFDI